MFSREIFVYTKLFKKFLDLVNKLQFPFQYVIPECYYVCRDYCNEAVVLENMCEKKYMPFTGSMFLNKEHINVALSSLAKFHAMSFILKNNDKDFYKEAESVCVPLNEITNKRFIEILLNRLDKALIIFENTEYKDLIQRIKNHCTRLIRAATASVERVCLCHGDIWKENVLFQYKDNIPISACIIDYQTTRISSPAFDVLYLIVTSTSSDLRRQYLTQFLDTYYETFEHTLTKANLNPHEEYSRNMFNHDLVIVGPTCFIIANTAIWLASGLQNVGHVKSKIVLETESEIFEAKENYKSIIKGIIDDLRSSGFLNVTDE
ncbi:hypothetical protein KGM_204673 [Danaus plexippus plexippus]|uniref:CHK kinase-like domain-containing protein n=1 Tax=Danaus plexippus plexippus TaxID=278856 RepID=A0A212FKD8_DANPL|nr:hypothetical protein KGM_204673 [Danaus plexippus plexippus]